MNHKVRTPLRSSNGVRSLQAAAYDPFLTSLPGSGFTPYYVISMLKLPGNSQA